jgi:hypothetical protein
LDTGTGGKLTKTGFITKKMVAYVRQENESTAAWLERLVGLDAPAHILAAVQQILAGEQLQKGKFIFPFHFLTIDR